MKAARQPVALWCRQPLEGGTNRAVRNAAAIAAMLETISRVRTVCAITLCALTLFALAHALACGEFSHSVDMINPLSHHSRAVMVVRYF